jgi:hypothetical protein
MSEAPERIWAWWDDEYDVGVVIKHGAKGYVPDTCKEYGYVPDTCKEYVRADRIEELEAERNALAEEIERLRKRVKDMSSDIRIGYIHCEALAEIKATVDGKSDQPVADIISGCIAEVAAYRATLAALKGDRTMSDDLVRQMNDARDFSANTCGASRHAAMIAEALCSGGDYPMPAEEPDHCGRSIAATVTALWECRTKLAKAVDALERIAHASDIYSVEANAEDQGADTLAYAHKSTCNLARTTLAELKGETEE